jgi:CRP-like cAMP-binding protein
MKGGPADIGRVEQLLEEQLRWLRAAAMPSVRETVADALATTQLRQAYELCDGTMKSNEIADKVGISKQGFSNWTRRWRNLGIAFEVEGRKIKHLISLAALELPLEVKEGA